MSSEPNSRSNIIAAVILLWFSSVAWCDEFELHSPDGSITVALTTGETISYRISIDGREIVGASRAALLVSQFPEVGRGGDVVNTHRYSEDSVIVPPVAVKESAIPLRFNALRLDFASDYSVEFRAFDDGIAYRFAISLDDQVRITDEVYELNIAASAKTYFPQEDSFKSHNERSYVESKVGELDPGAFASLPILFDAGAAKLLVTETDLQSYPGLWLKTDEAGALCGVLPPYPLQVQLEEGSDRNEHVITAAGYIAETEGTRTFPWRIFIIERDDAGLLRNQLPFLLAEESRIEDPSWIEPGNVAWDWWNANNVSGVEFRAGINTETYKHYIDFASEFGIDYVILDEGWYVLGDILDVAPEIDVEDLVEYGRERDVGVVLWVIWKTLDDQMQAAMEQFEAWGIVGLKIDFMARDDQPMVEFYWRAAEEAAKRKLLVNFHGAYKPAGLRRTYPNVLTREGVKGLEHNKWSEAITPTHNLTIPFIRMVAGPMDYTPGAMVNAQPKNFRIVFDRPMSMGTRAHQMAMYVVYESPMQMLADTPTHYWQEPEITQFIAEVPTTWDETQVLDAVIGERIVIARRNGETWYVAAMTNEDARQISIPTDFLGKGSYVVDAFIDGTNADRYASDLRRYTGSISRGATVEANLAPGGGWVAKFSRNTTAEE